MVGWQAPENSTRSITEAMIAIESVQRLRYCSCFHFFLQICGSRQAQATKVVHTRSPHAIFSRHYNCTEHVIKPKSTSCLVDTIRSILIKIVTCHCADYSTNHVPGPLFPPLQNKKGEKRSNNARLMICHQTNM